MNKADNNSGNPEEMRRRKIFDLKAKTAKEAIDQVVMANAVLANEGIFDYLGHVSVRNPENENNFFISRSCAPEMVRKKDILNVDLGGKVLTKTSFAPYREQIIHRAVYQARPEVHAVLHAHPLPVIVFSVLNIPIRPIAHFACRFYEDIPVYDEYDFTSPGATGMLITTKKEAERMAKRLGPGKAMLMRGHGFNVVAPSIPELVQWAITLRDNILIQLAAHQLGTPKYITRKEAKLSSNAFIGVGVERGWNYWVARAKKAYPDLKQDRHYTVGNKRKRQ